jgi:hypothetical protein
MLTLASFDRPQEAVMADAQRNARDYLKPRDVGTLPQRAGRQASDFYPSLVRAFVEAGEAAMDVDVARIGRKPDTVRAALVKSIKTLGLKEQVRVAVFRDEVVLLRR